MRHAIIIAASLLLGLLGGCTQQPKIPAAPTTEAASQRMACASKRPEICSRDYRPVCAARDTGVRCIKAPCPSLELKTYSNACSACADPKVLSYNHGRCMENSPTESQ